MYTPTKALNSKDVTNPRKLVMLIGPPGTGKTYSALTTFPNPIHAQFEPPPEDKEIKALGLSYMPFYNLQWVSDSFEFTEDKKPLNIKKPIDAFKYFIEKGDALKFTIEQTLVIDSLTSMLDIWTKENEKRKEATDNHYWIWAQKIEFLRDIHIALHKLQCHVVLTCHEGKEKDDTPLRKPTGKKIPWISGAYKDIIGSKYNNIIKTGVQEINGKPHYYWQVWPDDEYDLRCTFRSSQKLVKPTYQNFVENEKV